VNTILTNFNNFFSNAMPSIIPVYQRPYRWTDSDLNSLFGDIDEQNIVNGQVFNSIFVGPITVKNNAGRVYVIDGQQRLTTISLFFIASMRKLDFNSPVELDLINSIKTMLYIFGPAGQAIKLKLKPQDARNYEFVLNGNINHPDCDNQSLIVKNYIKACCLINEKITDHGSDESVIFEVVNDFVIKLKAAKFVQIDLLQTDDAQAIFESLNSKGKDLSTLEQICNLLFMKMNGDEQERCYEDYWRYIEENIVDDTDVNSFIKAFLTIQTGSFVNIKIADAYKMFRQYIRLNNVNQTDVMCLLFSYAKNYQWLNKEIILTNSPLLESMSTYRALKITQTLPLTLLLKEKMNANILSNENFNEIIKVVESYLIRRDICGLSTKSLNQYFSKIAFEIKNFETGIECVDSIKSTIVSLTGNGRCPRNNEVLDALDKFDFYHYSRNSIVINKLCNSYGIAVNQATTVEHIMPQSLDRWMDEITVDDQKNILNKTHQMYLHSIGNLTFLPRSLNSIAGNGTFLDKKITIATDFAICHDFHDEILREENITWGVKEILGRSKRLSNKIVEIFPFPNSTDVVTSPIFSQPLKEEDLQTYEKFGDLPKEIYRSIELLVIRNIPSILINKNSNYISFALGSRVCICVTPQQRGLRVLFNLSGDDLNAFVDRFQNIVLDISDVKHQGTGDALFRINSLNQINDFSDIFEYFLKIQNGDVQSSKEDVL
jgi:uncharacterized protein with ParB-like and HNH nuclease domain/predicted transport protein